MSNFGDRLRKLRKNRGYSQKEFGKIFDLSESTIGMYEREERKPDYDTLNKFADFFGVSVDFLIGRTDNPSTVREEKAPYNVGKEKSIYDEQKELLLTPDELKILQEIKKHPVLFHDLVNAPEKKIKQLIKMWKFIKQDLEDDDEDYGDGFGELDD
ncbi:hypothetical protein AZI98_08480 [Aeribacillus pallidus]|uniref:HTH cro/C1-type domain-containing protein n=1 Tax=Aeribacillus pallidus TaxID=33936 RepID=A0A165XVU8_9BACI|nr:helix-turn-helix domain-containing protein [Aeribacillus pallidus]KZN96459.1 hypothetical protein AZI98_08480 [Aeribacillus pallidus]